MDCDSFILKNKPKDLVKKLRKLIKEEEEDVFDDQKIAEDILLFPDTNSDVSDEFKIGKLDTKLIDKSGH